MPAMKTFKFLGLALLVVACGCTRTPAPSCGSVQVKDPAQYVNP